MTENSDNYWEQFANRLTPGQVEHIRKYPWDRDYILMTIAKPWILDRLEEIR